MPSATTASPAFSPDGRWIAFDAGRRIAIVRTERDRAAPAARRRHGCWAVNPAFSPNGTRIVFDAPRSAAPFPVTRPLRRGDRRLGRAKRVVRNAADPSWSVDGLFAFERPPDPILLATPGGSGSHDPMAPTPALSAAASVRARDYSTDPDFSPDGSRIVYYSRRGTGSRSSARTAAAPAGLRRPPTAPSPGLVAGRPVAHLVVGRHPRRPQRRHPRAPDREGPLDVRASFVFSSFTPSWRPLPPFSTR